VSYICCNPQVITAVMPIMPAPIQKQSTLPPPPLPTPPASPDVYVVPVTALPGGTLTRQDVAALRARRSELVGQLESATRTRRELSEQLRRAQGANKVGLENRLTALDGRIARMEGQIDEVGQQLASTNATRVAGTQPPATFGPRNMPFRNVNPEPIIISFTLFVLSPIAIAISRLIWKRGSRTMVHAPSADSSQRLERMEQAMDAIAIEIERVSEGQRFVTRLLSERGGAMLGGAQQAAEPMRVPLGNSTPTR
jgi:hypothetical protein